MLHIIKLYLHLTPRYFGPFTTAFLVLRLQMEDRPPIWMLRIYWIL